jgi:hypothetical protein
MRTRGYRQTLLGVLALGLACSAGAALLVEEPFTSLASNANTAYPSTAASATGYWTDDGTYNYFNRRGDVSPTDLVFSQLIPGGWDYANAFLSRSLYDSGELSAGQTFTDAQIVLDAEFQLTPTDTDDPGFLVRVLDASTNGYMGDLRYNGDVTIYRVDSGVLTSIASDTSGTAGTGVGARTITLSVTNGSVTLRDSLASGPISVADTTYSAFSEVGIGARVDEEVGFLKDVDVYGSVIPEPSTILSALIGVVLLTLRRKLRG